MKLFFKKYYMNKKLFNDYFPILIILILGCAYYFINDKSTNKTMIGGGFTQKGGAYPPGTPFLFQMRYVIYFLFVFFIIFILYYSYQSYLVSKISFFETGKAFLTSFSERWRDIKNKKYTKNDPEYKEYKEFVAGAGVDYAPYTNSFCTMFAPCSCCGIGDYNPSLATTSEANKAACVGVIPAKMS